MTQKSNDYQIKNLVEFLNKTLFLENAAIERLSTRIKETTIQEFKQRMEQHLESTYKQKDILEQMILIFRQRSDDTVLDSSQKIVNNEINTNVHTLTKALDKNGNFVESIKFSLEETEFAKIKLDYIVEYDELVAYQTLINLAETTDFHNKDDILLLLRESKREEESMVYWYQVHAPVVLDNLWPKMINKAMKRGQNYLTDHKNSRMRLVVMYADLVGSTNMSMTLPIRDLVLLIRAFTHELSNVIERYNGYVLKYSGDAVICFFSTVDNGNKIDTCKHAINCAKSMVEVIKKEINLILHEKYGYPQLQVKIGIDEGENAIIQYGYEENSPVDILGYGMNIVSKITSLTTPNGISIGENAYNLLDHKTQSEFQMLSSRARGWKYVNLDTKKPYKIYRYSLNRLN
ncbi:MAG TPA: DUF892 family protein [Phototrophicaceae bacterium]|nr:DUF892 family protein [Phototrophicaceae bacterium]